MARGPRTGWDDDGEGDALPWLEAVEDEGGGRGQDGGRTVTYVLIGVAVLALAIAAIGLFTGGDNATTPIGGNTDIIAAPNDPYKEAPDAPGGMKVEGEGDSVYAAGAGIDPDGTIDLTALPETPATRAPAVEAGDAKIVELPPAAVPAKPAPKPVEVSKAPPANPPAAPAKPASAAPTRPAAAPVQTAAAPAKPAPAPAAASPTAPAAGGYGLQLGAFSSQASAEAAWKTLSGRFGFLGSLGKSITATPSGGKTLYRLRAMGASKASAESLCARLKVAGEACSVVAP